MTEVKKPIAGNAHKAIVSPEKQTIAETVIGSVPFGYP